MSNLTGKQKRQLRATGQTLQPSVMVGKEGLTENVLEKINLVFETTELIKVRLTGPAGDIRKIISKELALQTQSEMVGLVGKTVLLYKENDDQQA